MQHNFLVSLIRIANLFSELRRGPNDNWKSYARDVLEESTFEDVAWMMEAHMITMPQTLDSHAAADEEDAAMPCQNIDNDGMQCAREGESTATCRRRCREGVQQRNLRCVRNCAHDPMTLTAQLAMHQKLRA